MSERTSHWHGLTLPCALALTGFLLRAYAVGAPSLRGDEGFSVGVANASLPEMFSLMGSVDPNPPLYLLFLRGWIALAGQSEFAVRWPSVLAGTLAVALTYRFGRALIHIRAGLVGALLAALSPLLIWYAQDARAYSIFVALVLAAGWQTWEVARSTHAPWRRWFVAGTLWWLALFTHYFAAISLAGLGLALLLASGTRPRWRPAVLTGLGVALAYLPWAVYVVPLLARETKNWITPTDGFSAVECALAASAVGPLSVGATPAWRLLGGGLLALLLLTGLALGLRRRNRTALIWLIASGPFMPMALWLISLLRPVFVEQYFIQSLPGTLLLAAWGVTLPLYLSRSEMSVSYVERVTRIQIMIARWASQVLVIGLSALALLTLQNSFFDPAYRKSPDLRGLMAYLDETARPNELILLNAPDPAFYYYYHGPLPVEVSPPNNLNIVGQAATEAQLSGLRDRFQHIRFFYQPVPGYDTDGFVGMWLRGCCEQLRDEQVSSLRIQTFDTPAGSLAARVAYLIELENGIDLTGYRLVSNRLAPGQTAHLTLFWTARQPVRDSYTVFVHLLAADGFILAQGDGTPRNGDYPTTFWQPGETVIDPHLIPLDEGTPPGSYRLAIGLYQRESGQRLTGRDPAGLTTDYHLLPLTVRVDQ